MQLKIVKPSSRHWATVPNQIVPDGLAEQLREIAARRTRMLGGTLVAFRDAGWGVAALAVACRMRPAAVAQQICRARRAGATSAIADVHGPRPADHRQTALLANGKRADPLADLTVTHLRELHAEARLVRARMRADHPCRLASAHLAEDVAALLELNYSKASIRRALGVTHRAVDHLLEQHGHRPTPPSALHRAGRRSIRRAA